MTKSKIERGNLRVPYLHGDIVEITSDDMSPSYYVGLQGKVDSIEIKDNSYALCIWLQGRGFHRLRFEDVKLIKSCND